MSAAGSSGEEMREEDLKKLTKNFRWLHRYNYGVMTHTETILLLIKKKKKRYFCSLFPTTFDVGRTITSTQIDNCFCQKL